MARQVKKVICELCGQKISASNYSKHLRRHQDHPETFSKRYLDHDDLFCKFCGKSCKNKSSVIQHEIRCKLNPSRINIVVEGFNSAGRVAWNRGLTKETDTRVAKRCATFKQNEALGLHTNWGHPFPEDKKAAQRERALKNGLGGFHMRKGIYYNGVKLDSSYEVMLAEDLDKHGIVWERCSRFPYYVDNVLHYYTPDFYLPDYDVYLEPKNDFLIENVNPFTGIMDVEKVQLAEIENNIRVIVLNKNQLNWAYISSVI